MSNTIPSVSVNYAGDGHSTRPNELDMRQMQEQAYQKRGEQYLLIKSPPASGKSRALMFIALDKLENQGLQSNAFKDSDIILTVHFAPVLLKQMF